MFSYWPLLFDELKAAIRGHASYVDRVRWAATSREEASHGPLRLLQLQEVKWKRGEKPYLYVAMEWLEKNGLLALGGDRIWSIKRLFAVSSNEKVGTWHVRLQFSPCRDPRLLHAIGPRLSCDYHLCIMVMRQECDASPQLDYVVASREEDAAMRFNYRILSDFDEEAEEDEWHANTDDDLTFDTPQFNATLEELKTWLRAIRTF
jgi:hypothetical protein